MIFNRAAPIEKRLDCNTPCWSGPRWISVAVASRIRWEGGVQFLCVYPTIPHKSFCLAEPRLKFRVPLFFVQATSGDCHSAVLHAAQRPIARRAGATRECAVKPKIYPCDSATAALLRQTVASPVQLYPRCDRSAASRKPDASHGLTSSSPVYPDRRSPAIPHPRRQARKARRGVRQMMQNAHGECQIEYGTNWRVQQVADHNVRVGKPARMRERNERTFAQIQ